MTDFFLRLSELFEKTWEMYELLLQLQNYINLQALKQLTFGAMMVSIAHFSVQNIYLAEELIVAVTWIWVG